MNAATAAQETFGRFELVRRLGRGGMAEVYLARVGTGEAAKYLAIKRLLANYAQNRRVVKRLANEAKLTVWLTHPNIVQVFDFGRLGEHYFIAMEYVDGCDLRAVIRPRGSKQPGRQLPLEVALDLTYQIGDALRYAHHCTDAEGRPLGIIHRDISPHNVLISRDGHPKLADFGIARAQISEGLSQPGAVLGKLNYIPPEQAKGLSCDARVDIYACGALLYEMLAGQRAFVGATRLTASLDRRPRPLAEVRPTVPEEINAIVQRAMAPLPDERYPDAEAMCDALLVQIEALGGRPKPHQLQMLVTEALEAQAAARGGQKKATILPASTAVARREDLQLEQESLIGEEVTAVRAMGQARVAQAELAAQSTDIQRVEALVMASTEPKAPSDPLLTTGPLAMVDLPIVSRPVEERAGAPEGPIAGRWLAASTKVENEAARARGEERRALAAAPTGALTEPPTPPPDDVAPWPRGPDRGQRSALAAALLDLRALLARRRREAFLLAGGLGIFFLGFLLGRATVGAPAAPQPRRTSTVPTGMSAKAWKPEQAPAPAIRRRGNPVSTAKARPAATAPDAGVPADSGVPDVQTPDFTIVDAATRSSAPVARHLRSRKRATDSEQLDRLAKSSWKAFRLGHYREVMRLTSRLLRASPNDRKALSMRGVAACQLGRRKEARDAYRRLDGPRQRMMEQYCGRLGIEL